MPSLLTLMARMCFLSVYLSIYLSVCLCLSSDLSTDHRGAILSYAQKVESDSDLSAQAGMGSSGTTSLNQSNMDSLDTNISVIGADRTQMQKLATRSFLNKFEHDYMNPIFGGPEVVSDNTDVIVVLNFSANRYRLHLRPCCQYC